ncbi:ferrous iron transport protein B [Effusibacillus lacus]|uniref:Ferrous iron transport protein B n=1 Tax=Effusibacillus lacus TaxID=1348429 RepID=A0A292YLT8_9BACL|nr:ferrous iron transport protein B [Effusibacillus lacus]TCS71243.1 ferrous iron transport protein B [Effusibacillus lacus]GAX89869.1 ferrous iron transport protein B [Effusibacillus lacus]
MASVALAGNPNTGKTSLFNELTGSYEYVGNWAGVTVEKKVGILKNKQARLIDLPGIYSLHPLSRDEGVATRFLLSEEFTSIINIVDASQLDRNLYLTVQLLEYGKPMLIGLNMMDVAKHRGLAIDHEKLASLLQIPVIPIIARTGTGCDKILETLGSGRMAATPTLRLDYGPVLEESIARLAERLQGENLPPKRWLALQYFEGNPLVAEMLETMTDGEWLQRLRIETEQTLARIAGAKSLDTYIRDTRRNYIAGLLEQSVTRKKDVDQTLSDRIDRLATNRFLGMPLFLLFMFVTFKLTFDWLGSPLSDLLDGFFTGPVVSFFDQVFTWMGASAFLKDLVLQGIVPGVGGVLVFVPQIFILFLIISFIEDSGYMARVAMVMDRLMEGVGLNGKAFIPMIIGFGCNVPGIMAARTVEQPRERLTTTLLIPFMSCSARLSVYSLFVAAFFAENQALIVLSLYVMGIIVALVMAKLFSKVFHQEKSVFVVELPPYRFPQWRTLFRSTWEKGKGFVKKAGTFIFGGSVLIWVLGYAGPGGFNVDMNESFLAGIGSLLAPLFAPLGFGNWQSASSLMTGFFAKEVVVSTMNIIFAAPDIDTLQGMMANYFTPLQAYSFLTFLLLYVPCLATVAVIRKETASAKWTWFSVCYGLAIAYILSLLIYQGGKLLGFN